MEESETPHPDYQKGFNEGYTMKKHLPDLADKLAESIDQSLRGTGFQDGRNEVILELKKARYPDWLKSDRLSDTDRTKDRSKDMDKDDLER